MKHEWTAVCRFKTWYSLPGILYSGEGEWNKAGRLGGPEAARSPKAFPFPSIQKDASV